MSSDDAYHEAIAVEAAPEWVGDIAALAAHELGNAMTVLSFAVDTLRAGQRSPEEVCAVDELEFVVTQASTLTRLLARLFAPPSLAVGIDLKQVIADAMPLLQHLGTRPLEASMPDEPVSIVASRSKVELALFELMLSVSRLGGPEGATRLALERSPGDGVRVAVEVDREGRAGVSCDAAGFARARALAEACAGALTLSDLPSGALRIELEFR
jgi:signal transduction histidine kinase